MIYKGISVLLNKKDSKNVKSIKTVIDNFVDGKKRSECAIIDSVLKVESNNTKLFKTTFCTVHEVDHYRYICYTTEGNVVTNNNNEIIYIHPNKYLVPQTKIDSKEFLDYTAPKTQVLSNNEIMELNHMKKYLIELENLGQQR